MNAEDHWDLRKSLAVILAVFSFICVLLGGVGSSDSLSAVIQTGLLVSAVSGAMGFLCGYVVKLVFREARDPRSSGHVGPSTSFTKTLEGLRGDVVDELEGAIEQNNENDKDVNVNTQELIEEQHKEKIMVPDSS